MGGFVSQVGNPFDIKSNGAALGKRLPKAQAQVVGPLSLIKDRPDALLVSNHLGLNQ